MALTSANVRVGVTGVVSTGPTTATAPTDSSSALTGFTDLGYVGEGGVTESRSRSTNDIKAWQNAALVRRVVTDSELTYSLTLIESTEAVLELFYAASATNQDSTDGELAVVPANTGGRRSFVFDVVDGTEKVRIYVAEGEITEVGDVVYASGEAIGYQITVTAYPTATGESAQIWSTALATA